MKHPIWRGFEEWAPLSAKAILAARLFVVMSDRSMKALAIIAAALLGLHGCWESVYSSGTWRYRLTLVVDDNGNLTTGSGVIEIEGVSTRDIPLPIPGNTGGVGVRHGEAVMVDLGSKGTLFALLTKESDTNRAASIVYHIFPPPGDGKAQSIGVATPEGIRYFAHLKGKRDVPFDQLPMLVRFRDISDPKTVEKVDPNDLTKSFGLGVRLVSATIEMTDDPVTTGIEKRLGWLPERTNIIGYLGGWPDDSSKLYLNGSEFSRGTFK